MRLDEYVRRAVNHIDVGPWVIHRDTWLNYLPNINAAGQPPPVTAATWSDFPKLAQESKNAPLNAPAYKVVSAGLHRIVLHESIFLLHKAWHVLGAAERHAAIGQPTWAQSSAYQAAFFAAKATLGFLGHPLVEYRDRLYLVRLFPVERRSKNQKGGPIHPSNSLEVIYLDKPFGHRNIWEIYQRALNTAQVDDSIWPSDTKQFLKLLDADDFAAERNAIHYQSAWIFDDLFMDVEIPELGVPDTVEKRWSFPHGGFSMRLGERCFYLGVALLANIAELAPSLTGDTGLFKSTSTQGRHPSFFESYA